MRLVKLKLDGGRKCLVNPDFITFAIQDPDLRKGSIVCIQGEPVPIKIKESISAIRRKLEARE